MFRSCVNIQIKASRRVCILNANMNLVNKETAKNGKICKKKSKRNKTNEKSEKNHQGPSKSSRIYKLPFRIAQITGDTSDTFERRSSVKVQR